MTHFTRSFGLAAALFLSVSSLAPTAHACGTAPIEREVRAFLTEEFRTSCVAIDIVEVRVDPSGDHAWAVLAYDSLLPFPPLIELRLTPAGWEIV